MDANILNDETVEEIENTLKLLFGKNQKFEPGEKGDSTLIKKMDGEIILKTISTGLTGGDVITYNEDIITTNDEIKVYKRVGYYRFPYHLLVTSDESHLSSNLEYFDIVFRIKKNTREFKLKLEEIYDYYRKK